MTFANGDVYEGAISHSQRQGAGVYTFKNGNDYQGNFLNDKYSGCGVYEDDNMRFEGNFTNGSRDGYGVEYYKTEGVKIGNPPVK